MPISPSSRKWTYLVVFNTVAAKHDCLRDFLDRQPGILDWYSCIPNTIFVVSSLDANGVAEVIRQFTRNKGYFLVLDTETDKGGWLPKAAWDFMRNKTSQST